MNATQKLLAISILIAVGFEPSRTTAQFGPPPPVALPVPQVRQTTIVWCWLAVSEMIVRYKHWGNSPSQCQMMENGYGLPPGICCGNPNICARAGGLQEIQAIIAFYGGSFSMLTPPNDPMTLYSLLASRHPVIAALATQLGGGHVVVIRGMRFNQIVVPTPWGPQPQVVPIVLLNDPMSIFPGEVPYVQLLGAWQASIVVQ